MTISTETQRRRESVRHMLDGESPPVIEELCTFEEEDEDGDWVQPIEYFDPTPTKHPVTRDATPEEAAEELLAQDVAP